MGRGETHCYTGNYYYSISPDWCGESGCNWLCDILKPGGEAPNPPPANWGPGHWETVTCFCDNFFDPGYQWTFWHCVWCWVEDDFTASPSSLHDIGVIATTDRFAPSASMKWEPFDCLDPTEKILRIADWADASNILFQYNPDSLITPYCYVSGVLVPDAVAWYFPDGETNGKPAYSGPLRAFRIQWDGVDSWILAEQWAGPDNPRWKRTNPSVIGDYTPQSGASGIATASTV